MNEHEMSKNDWLRLREACEWIQSASVSRSSFYEKFGITGQVAEAQKRMEEDIAIHKRVQEKQEVAEREQADNTKRCEVSYDEIRDRLVQKTLDRTIPEGWSLRAVLTEHRTINLDFGRQTGATTWGLRYCASNPGTIILASHQFQRGRLRNKAREIGLDTERIVINTYSELVNDEIPKQHTGKGTYSDDRVRLQDCQMSWPRSIHTILLENSETASEEVKAYMLDLAVDLNAKLLVHL